MSKAISVLYIFRKLLLPYVCAIFGRKVLINIAAASEILAIPPPRVVNAVNSSYHGSDIDMQRRLAGASVVTITASQTWTCPATTRIDVLIVAGGGGGGNKSLHLSFLKLSIFFNRML